MQLIQNVVQVYDGIIVINSMAFYLLHKGVGVMTAAFQCWTLKNISQKSCRIQPIRWTNFRTSELFPFLCAVCFDVQPMVRGHDVWGWDYYSSIWGGRLVWHNYFFLSFPTNITYKLICRNFLGGLESSIGPNYPFISWYNDFRSCHSRYDSCLSFSSRAFTSGGDFQEERCGGDSLP